jgi:hypothetical protein
MRKGNENGGEASTEFSVFRKLDPFVVFGVFLLLDFNFQGMRVSGRFGSR